MLIILDRDGVINYESTAYVKSPKEWIPLPGSLEAITQLYKAKHTIVVATNQSGVGRGYYSEKKLEAIHHKMRQLVQALGGDISGIYFCPHTPDDQCRCRKPEPGLLLAIAKDYPTLFKTAIYVGDSLRDIQAAQTAGCQAVLVKTGNGLDTIKNQPDIVNTVPIFENLNDFANQFCRSVSAL